MAYPDDKETWDRVETDDIIQKEHKNVISDFLERLQDTLGLGIKKGYDTVRLLLDYLKTECDKVTDKFDKTGGTIQGDVTIRDAGQYSGVLTLDSPDRGFKDNLYAYNGYIYIKTDNGLYLKGNGGADSYFSISPTAAALHKKLNMVNKDIYDCKSVSISGDGDFVNAKNNRGLVVRTPDDTKDYRIRVDNAGAIVTEQVV